MGEPYVVDALYPPFPQSAGQAREWVAGHLRQLAPGRFYPDGLLVCVSELATNAVRHGPSGYDFRIRLDVDETGVRVEVYDFGDGTPRICRSCERRHDTEHGRGLVLVEGLADAWGVEAHPRGKTVWCMFKTDTYAAGVARLAAVAASPPPPW